MKQILTFILIALALTARAQVARTDGHQNYAHIQPVTITIPLLGGGIVVDRIFTRLSHSLVQRDNNSTLTFEWWFMYPSSINGSDTAWSELQRMGDRQRFIDVTMPSNTPLSTFYEEGYREVADKANLTITYTH